MKMSSERPKLFEASSCMIFGTEVQNGNWIHLGMSHKQESGILTVGNMPTVKHIIE